MSPDDEDTAAEVSEHSADAAGMGTGGFDDPSFSGSKGQSGASVTDGYLSNYGLSTFGPDTVDRDQQIGSMLGITPGNPFGYKSPFSGFTDALGISLDYSNIFSAPEMNAIAQKNVDVYSNPNNTPGLPGFDKDQPANQPRSGIQRGFGSLFNPVGQQTAFGKIAAQRPNDPLGSLAIGAFSNLAGFGLPSIMAQSIGRDTYAAKGTPGYNPTIDPASPSFTGPSSMGGIVDTLSMLGTGMTSTTAQEVYGATKEAVEEAISYFSNPKGGSDVTSISTVANSPTVGIASLDSIEKSKADEAISAINNMFSTPPSSRTMSRDEIKDAYDRSIKENVEIPSNISFSDLMNATTLGTPEYEATKGGDFSSITSGSSYFD